MSSILDGLTGIEIEDHGLVFTESDIRAAEAELQKRVAELERKATIYDTLHAIAKSRGFDCVTDAVKQAASVAVPHANQYLLSRKMAAPVNWCNGWDACRNFIAALSTTPQPAVAEPMRVPSGWLSSCPEPAAETSATASVAGLKRCEYCDGTGDVHSADGEWRGECKACKPAPLKVPSDEVLWELWAVALGGGGYSLRDVIRRFAELLLAEVQKGGSHD